MFKIFRASPTKDDYAARVPIHTVDDRGALIQTPNEQAAHVYHMYAPLAGQGVWTDAGPLTPSNTRRAEKTARPRHEPDAIVRRAPDAEFFARSTSVSPDEDIPLWVFRKALPTRFARMHAAEDEFLFR